MGVTPNSRYAVSRSPSLSRYPGYSYSRYPSYRYPSIARYTRGYYGPRFGVPGYSSCFTRYTPYHYGPAYFHRPWYPSYYGYPYYRSGFSIGFGFYSSCYSYPTYPLAYYPTYYAPAYPVYVPTYYASSVLVTTPTYQYVPEPVIEYPAETYVSGAQYATADSYVAAGGTVEAPQVVYDDGNAETYAEAPQQSAPPAGQYVEAPAGSDTYVENQVNVYSTPSDAPAPQASVTPQWTDPQATGQAVAPQGVSPQPMPQDSAVQPMPQYEQPQPPAAASPSVQPAPMNVPPAPPVAPTAPQPQQVPAPQEAQAPAQPAPAQAAPADQQTEAQPAEGQGEELPPLTEEQIKELQELMVSGTQGFAEGRYVEAAEKFGKVTGVDPHNVDAALAHAVARFATGDYAAAADSIRLGISLFPPIVDSVFDLRERYQKTGDFVSQAKTLERYLDKQPGDADALLVLGFVRHFSDQRDLAEQAFERLKKISPEDAELADVFLNALPPEQAAALATQPAPAGSDEPGALNVSVNRGAMGVPTTQPGLEGVLGGPADPGVLSVTTQPAPMQKIEIPSSPAFDGKLSLTEANVPREQKTVDGIEVRLKGTDDLPPQAYVEITIGDRRMKVKRFIPGAHVPLKGASGAEYKLVLTEVDNKTETIRYMVAKQ